MNLTRIEDPAVYALVLQLLKKGLLPGGGGSTVLPSDITGSAYPSGNSASGINTAVAALGSTWRTLHLAPGVWTIDSPVTIPTNVHLEVDVGTVLTKSGTGSLIINGPFSAPLSQVFSGFPAGGVVFGGPTIVFPQWWGALGNGTADDTAALQAALTAAQGAIKGRLSIPNGTYKLTAPLSASATPCLIEGWSMSGTKLTAAVDMAAIFQFADVTTAQFFDFRTLLFDGNHHANAGVVSAKIAHSSFRRVQINGTKVAGLDLGSGWCNEINDCEIAYNDGDGVLLRALNNVNNIRDCKIFGNAGLGVRALGTDTLGYLTTGLRVEGCTIESNAQGGIYFQQVVMGGRIVGNHFENNAATGLVFTTPAVTLKADILINGSSLNGKIDNTYPCRTLVVEGNVFDSPGVASAIIVCSVLGLRVAANSVMQNEILVGVYRDSGVAGIQYIEIDGTNVGGGGAFVPIDYVGPGAVSRPLLISTRIARTNPFNYFPQDIGALSTITPRNGGKAFKSDQVCEGVEAWELTGDASIGFMLDLDKYTELRGQLLLLSARTWASNLTGAWLEINGNTDIDSYQVFYQNQWFNQAMAVRAGNSGTMPIGFRRVGDPSVPGTHTLVAKVSLVVVGAEPLIWNPQTQPRRLGTVAPTAGLWSVGDRVYHNAPAAAGIEGWVCTTAGAQAPDAWQNTHGYNKWADWVSNGGNVYECITSGTSAGAGGPTTTSADITDGTAHWKYIGPLGVFKAFGAIAA